jgi:hypothetical protein
MENSHRTDYQTTAKSALGALFVAISVVIAAALLSGAWKRSHPTQEFVVSVTGSATQDFQSDLIVWSGSFSQKAPVMKDAYEGLKRNAASIKNYLIAKGVNANEIVFSSVDIRREFKTIKTVKKGTVDESEEQQIFDGYTLSQSVKIESHEVEKIEKVSREVTELIDQGVELNSDAPNYYYTKLAELKIKMLSNATADARNRAEKITDNAKSSLGKLRNASMGIFQITAQNSSEEYTYGGAFNTTSKWKTASISVKLEFAVD